MSIHPAFTQRQPKGNPQSIWKTRNYSKNSASGQSRLSRNWGLPGVLRPKISVDNRWPDANKSVQSSRSRTSFPQ
ncbi:MAG: hypothetical protein JO370_09585 [Paucibacter sp.]|nr:hypothetical protein [Roseateles sp.]